MLTHYTEALSIIHLATAKRISTRTRNTRVVTHDDNRDDIGRYEETHDDEDYFESVARHEPAGTRDVADDLDVNVETARLRLKQLAADDELVQQTVGGRLLFLTP